MKPILLIFLTSLMAADIVNLDGKTPEEILPFLSNEDFIIREQSTKQMSLFGPDKLEWFIEQHFIFKTKDPEVSFRLYDAAKSIYLRTEILKTSAYRSLMAELGFYYTTVYQYEKEFKFEEFLVDHRTTGYKAVIHVHEDGLVHNKLKLGDILISSFDDMEWTKPALQKVFAGEVRQVKILRFKELTFPEDEEIGSYLQQKLASHDPKEIIELNIQIGWKEVVNPYWKQTVEIEEWAKFYETRKMVYLIEEPFKDFNIEFFNP